MPTQSPGGTPMMPSSLFPEHRSLKARRQRDLAGTIQHEQQAPADHVAQGAVGLPPVPFDYSDEPLERNTAAQCSLVTGVLAIVTFTIVRMTYSSTPFCLSLARDSASRLKWWGVLLINPLN